MKRINFSALPLIGGIIFSTRGASAAGATFSTIQPSPSEIKAAQATIVPLSPTSDVKGVVFNRIIQIWLENTDYDDAENNEDMKWLASQGILLTNFFAVTHPSQPNYAAVVAGDHFGLDHDGFMRYPENVSTVVDLLETKGISWSEYQEHLPYAGYQGFYYKQQETLRNDYVRKHNPLILFDSVVNNDTRRLQIKSFKSFEEDLNKKTLPQWMFITPNMANDGHDTGIKYAGTWLKTFLEPLLKNNYFMNDTLLVITFDENDSSRDHNTVYTLLLGDAVPKSLQGTTDDTYYTHYSVLSTISANWDLPSLGRWDCGASVLGLVASKTSIENPDVDTANIFNSQSYPGPLSIKRYTPGKWPAPATNAECVGGNGVLDSVKKTWGDSDGDYNFTNAGLDRSQPPENRARAISFSLDVAIAMAAVLGVILYVP